MRGSVHTVVGSSRAFAVFRGGRQVSRWLTHHDTAAARANALDRQDRVQLRNCLCCRKVFQSTGRHHRLCDPCRKSA